MTRINQQTLLPLLLCLGVAGVASNAMIRLVFAALGQTPEQAAWSAVVMLYGFLGGAGIGVASRSRLGQHSQLSRLGLPLSGICSGALIGFFYVGNYFGQDIRAAIAGALMGAGLMLACSRIAQKTSQIATLVMGAIAAYGCAFLVWTTAIAGWQTARYGLGLGLLVVALGFLGWATDALQASVYEISQLPNTPLREKP